MQDTLFAGKVQRPLADRMRPEKITDIVGQEQLLGENAPLRRMIDNGKLSSFILWGPPGCGKTTLLRIISGLEEADSGTLYGVLPSEIAFLFQEDRLLPWLTALKNVESVIKDKEKTPLAKEILTALNLGDEKDLSAYPSELSGGMARRVAIARALAYLVANDCSVLILDEALRGLDKGNVDNTVEVIRRYSQGKTVISVTHNPSALEESAAKTLIM